LNVPVKVEDVAKLLTPPLVPDEFNGHACCEPSGACRGAANLAKLCCKHTVANDDNYALAA